MTIFPLKENKTRIYFNGMDVSQNLQSNEKLEKKLRKYYKNVALTTDIIVGFPEETNEEFVQTYNYLNKIDF